MYMLLNQRSKLLGFILRMATTFSLEILHILNAFLTFIGI